MARQAARGSGPRAARRHLPATVAILPVLAIVGGCGGAPEPSAVASAPVSMPGSVPGPMLESAGVAAGGMVLVPAGEFVMGSDRRDEEGLQARYGFTFELFVNEHPPHRVALGAYYIDRFEVTNAEYKRFIMETGYPEPAAWVQNAYNVADRKLETAHVGNLRWIAADYFGLDYDTSGMEREELLAELLRIQRERDRLPVSGVSWQDAENFCRWRGARLPTEAEWERAARGPQSLEFPWGNDWEPSRPNTGDRMEEDESLAPVGAFPGDVSPFGVHDMAGNVSEWVADWYLPYDGSEHWEEAYGQQHKVIRGGGAGLGHYALSVFYRGARRGHAPPDTLSTDVGFRCARSG